MIPKEELEQDFIALKQYFDDILAERFGDKEAEPAPPPEKDALTVDLSNKNTLAPNPNDDMYVKQAQFFSELEEAFKKRGASMKGLKVGGRRARPRAQETDLRQLATETTINDELQKQESGLLKYPKGFLSKRREYKTNLGFLPSSSQAKGGASPSKDLRSLGRGGRIPLIAPRVK